MNKLAEHGFLELVDAVKWKVKTLSLTCCMITSSYVCIVRSCSPMILLAYYANREYIPSLYLFVSPFVRFR